MKIYVIRHGQTESNVKGIINGQRLDEPLSDQGKIQVKEAVDNLKVEFSKMYVSDMTRTRQTAEILNEVLNIPVSYHSELKEVDFGDLSGIRWNTHKENGINVFDDFVSQDYNFIPHGGESFDLVKNRLFKIIEQIKLENENENENVLIVSHGGIVRALNKMYTDNGVIESTQNAGLYEFEV